MSNDDIQILDIDHIGAPVWNADAATAFFERVGKDVVLDDMLPEYNIRAVFLDFNDVYLEFLEPTGPGNVKTFLERHGPGYQHMAYRVPNIDATVERLRADGVTFQSDDPIPGAGETCIIFIEERHTAGFQVELVERL
jgi:methylmalonyl-CoA/ethylmalonyl-CoA epimerase